MTLSHDDRQMQRYLDGELSDGEAAAFAARMLADGRLRERVEALERVRGGFAAAAEREVARAPAGFTAGVLAEVRRLPAREELQQRELFDGAVRLCRRVLLAAALLIGLGLAWHLGLLDRNRAGSVKASSGEVEREMERLDQRIVESMEAPPRGR
ncbi:MAG TPA: hypothetical protein ENI87_05885 [bacterium]|nr:hypothetical protein [bacterium]